MSTAGTFVGALHFNIPAPNTTVNGVTFTGVVPPGGNNNFTFGNFNFTTPNPSFAFGSTGSGSAPFSTLSAPYQSLLSGALGTTTFPATVALTMNSLVAGATYQFEWWANDSRVGNPFINVTATAGSAVTLNADPTGNVGGLGQFALGTFVADATNSQVINFVTPTGSSIVFNAFQLRQLAPPSSVPEPGTALAGAMMLGLCGALRRRRAA